MKKVVFSFVTLLICLPQLASAHVKWFAESIGDARPYAITDWPVIVWIFVALAAVGFGILVEKKFGVPGWIQRHINAWAPFVLSLASVGFGFAFIMFSLNGFVFAPNLPVEGSVGMALLVLQFVAGLMILLGFYERIGAFLILVLYGFLIREHGVWEVIDTLEIVGFAIYALFIGRPKWRLAEAKWLRPIFHRSHVYGVPLLRAATGVNLIILGFSEKILAPALTQNFLTHYDWNIMQMIGLHWFTDYWFAFSAGMAEIIFGLFFLFGLTTRVTTIALACFLVTTLVVLGPIELIGHLPHFSIALVFLVLGSGSRLRLVRANSIA
jgi:uncharacterized membrane protein YphA (DoxX/SURF4 family)